jgi:hypothetical protein
MILISVTLWRPFTLSIITAIWLFNDAKLFCHEKNAPYKELFIIFIRHEDNNNIGININFKSLIH